MTNLITNLPLQFILTKESQFKRQNYLDKNSIKELIGIKLLEFVIADIGKELNWITKENCFEFWKTELQLHLANDHNHIKITNNPNEYVYVASLWTNESNSTIILLEKFH